MRSETDWFIKSKGQKPFSENIRSSERMFWNFLRSNPITLGCGILLFLMLFSLLRRDADCLRQQIRRPFWIHDKFVFFEHKFGGKGLGPVTTKETVFFFSTLKKLGLVSRTMKNRSLLIFKQIFCLERSWGTQTCNDVCRNNGFLIISSDYFTQFPSTMSTKVHRLSKRNLKRGWNKRQRLNEKWKQLLRLLAFVSPIPVLNFLESW